MKVGLICYHRNLNTFCSPEIVEQYKYSILNQTRGGFDVMEVNYGGTEERIFQNSIFESKGFPTFVHCMNYMLDVLFNNGYDCVLNSNIDDRYAINRVEKQVPYIEMGYDIVSSNFALMREGKAIHYHHFATLDIEQELNNNHNVLAHPVIAYSKAFWQRNRYVPEEVPVEDLLLWKRAIKNSKMIILPDNLLYQNLHNNSVCQSDNR